MHPAAWIYWSFARAVKVQSPSPSCSTTHWREFCNEHAFGVPFKTEYASTPCVCGWARHELPMVILLVVQQNGVDPLASTPFFTLPIRLEWTGHVSYTYLHATAFYCVHNIPQKTRGYLSRPSADKLVIVHPLHTSLALILTSAPEKSRSAPQNLDCNFYGVVQPSWFSYLVVFIHSTVFLWKLSTLIAFSTPTMGLPPGDSQGRMLIVVVTVFEAFAITAVVLRLWSRRLKKTSLLLNDYLVLLALVFMSKNNVLCLN